MRDRTAFGMNFEEFCQSDMECNNAHNVFCKEKPMREQNESLLDFLKAGSKSLKKNPTICGKLS